jgi:hypothetical protein
MFNHTGGLLLQTVFFMINKDSETSLTINTIEQVRRGEGMCENYKQKYNKNKKFQKY